MFSIATPSAPSTLTPLSSLYWPSRITRLRSSAADHEVVGGDRDRLVVHAGRDQDQVAGRGAVDRRLDRAARPSGTRIVCDRPSAWGFGACSVTAAGTVPSALRTITVPYISLVRGAVERARVPVDAGLVELVVVVLARLDRLRRRPRRALGVDDDVVLVPARRSPSARRCPGSMTTVWGANTLSVIRTVTTGALPYSSAAAIPASATDDHGRERDRRDEEAPAAAHGQRPFACRGAPRARAACGHRSRCRRGAM